MSSTNQNVNKEIEKIWLIKQENLNQKLKFILYIERKHPCDRKVSLKFKTKFYKIMVTTAISYKTEYCAMNKTHNCGR